MTVPVIIAVDPGTRDTGVAVVRAERLVHTAKLHVPATWSLGARVFKLLLDLADETAAHYPLSAEVYLVYERPIIMHGSQSRGGITIRTTARDMRSMHELVGALEYWGRCRNFRVTGYEVDEIKLGIGGSRRASKEQVEAALRLAWDLSHLTQEPQSNHEWDALSVAHYHISQKVVRDREIEGSPR